MDTDVSAPPRDFSSAFDFGRALAHAWAAIRRCTPILWVGGCIRMCTSGGGGGSNGGGGGNEKEGASLLRDGADAVAGLWERGPAHAVVGAMGGLEGIVIVGILVAVVVLVAIGLAIHSWFRPGWIRLHEEIARTGEGTWGTLFGTTEPFMRMAGWTLLRGAIGIGMMGILAIPIAVAVVAGGDKPDPMLVGAGVFVAVLAAIPAVWVWLGTAFGDSLVALDGATPMEALDQSWELTRGHRLDLLIFFVVLWIVGGLFAIAGIFALCIGILVTAPLSYALIDFGFTESYLLYTRKPSETRAWSIWTWAAG